MTWLFFTYHVPSGILEVTRASTLPLSDVCHNELRRSKFKLSVWLTWPGSCSYNLGGSQASQPPVQEDIVNGSVGKNGREWRHSLGHRCIKSLGECSSSGSGSFHPRIISFIKPCLAAPRGTKSHWLISTLSGLVYSSLSDFPPSLPLRLLSLPSKTFTYKSVFQGSSGELLWWDIIINMKVLHFHLTWKWCHRPLNLWVHNLEDSGQIPS